MRLGEVKEHIKYHSSYGKKLPEDEVLESMLLRALYFVCDNCEPGELLRDGVITSPLRVYRHLEGGKCLITPEVPDFSYPKRHLQIDEPLTFAVIEYVCFLLTRNPHHLQATREIIGLYVSNYARLAFDD